MELLALSARAGFVRVNEKTLEMISNATMVVFPLRFSLYCGLLYVILTGEALSIVTLF